jgi:hypothetical protein
LRTFEESWILYQAALQKQRQLSGHENDQFLLRQKENDEIKSLVRWMTNVRMDAAMLANSEKPKKGLTLKRRGEIEAVLGERFWEVNLVCTFEDSWTLYQAALQKQRQQPGRENDQFLSRQKENGEINDLVNWMTGIRMDAAMLANSEKPKKGLTLERRGEIEEVLGERFWEERLLRTFEESWILYQAALQKQRQQPGRENDQFLLLQSGNPEINTLVLWMNEVRFEASQLGVGGAASGPDRERFAALEAVLGERFWEVKQLPRTLEESWALYQVALAELRQRPGHANDRFLKSKTGNKEICALVSWMKSVRVAASKLETEAKSGHALTLEQRTEMEMVLGEQFWNEKVLRREFEENWMLYQVALAKQRQQPSHEQDRFLSKQKGNEELKSQVGWMNRMRSAAADKAQGSQPDYEITVEQIGEMETVLGERFWEVNLRADPQSSRRDDSVPEQVNYRRSLASEGFNGIGLERSNPRVSFGARNKSII